MFGTYYGSKVRLVKKGLYPRPPSDVKMIVEPFLGGGAYMARYYDMVDRIVGIEYKQSNIDAIEYIRQNDITGIELIHGMVVDDISDDPKFRAFLHLVSSVGSSASRKVSLYGSSRWEYKKRKIESLKPMIDKLELICGDAFDYFEKYDSPETLWFIDPPYMGKAGEAYRTPKIDYDRLAKIIRKLKGYVIVCGGPDCNYLPFTQLCESRSLMKRLKVERIYKQRFESTKIKVNIKLRLPTNN